MAAAMADHPMIRLGVKLHEISDGVGFDQAIDVLAFLQCHLPASTGGDFGQKRTAAIDLHDQAFTTGNESADSAFDLILYGYAADIATRQGNVFGADGHLGLAADR